RRCSYVLLGVGTYWMGRPVPPAVVDRISPVDAFRAWDWPQSLKEAIQSFEFVKRLPGEVHHCQVLSGLVNSITAATWGLLGTKATLWSLQSCLRQPSQRSARCWGRVWPL
ncbi:hypothetical protein FOZ62_010872, partial [Perkinsus olseni]